MKLSERAQGRIEIGRSNVAVSEIGVESEGVSNDFQVHQVPSATSVFRTSSSLHSNE